MIVISAMRNSEKIQLKKAQKNSSWGKENSCAVCGKFFTQSDLLKAYYKKCKENKQNKEYETLQSGIKEFDEINISQSKFATFKEKPYCYKCDLYYKTEESQKFHVRDVHANPETRTCIMCKKKFSFSKRIEICTHNWF